MITDQEIETKRLRECVEMAQQKMAEDAKLIASMHQRHEELKAAVAELAQKAGWELKHGN